ncbi:hypothetical protein PtA15_2A373 [Puccinia triticina]|uniref:Uncharacterized protein n=1 Tax=Puccinia triticina TaxID=208348 RepID=A0ABY7CA92_9BASI|nr:uncharacterized protein PtA15_2A373 [Puccinia triticina]WAQ82060.1 hypothetical protein PtA15_2A373 [Puccinia triticina]
MSQGQRLDGRPAGASTSSELATRRKNSLLELQSTLPKLRQVLIKLRDSVGEPQLLLKLVEENQPALVESWDQIKRACSTLFLNGQLPTPYEPDDEHTPPQYKPNDQHTNELKPYRIAKVHGGMMGLMRLVVDIIPACHRYYAVTQHRKDPAEDSEFREKLRISKNDVVQYTSYPVTSIDFIDASIVK